MKIKAPVAALLNAVAFANSAVQKRHTLPILSNLLIDAREDMIVIIGTDLEAELEYRMPVGGDIEVVEAGKTTLPAKKLHDLLRGIGNNEAIATIAPDTKNKSGDRYTLSVSGLRSRYTLSGLSGDDYPNIDGETKGIQLFTVDANRFLHCLSTVAPSMANQDVRYYLNGLNMTSDNGSLVMTATDGHRLAQNRAELVEFKEDLKVNAIIPRLAVTLFPAQLKGASGELKFGITSNHIMVKTSNPEGGEKVIKSKLVDGNFPDYKRVIPKTEKQVVTLPRLPFTAALKRAAILSNEKFRGVRLTFDNTMLKIVTNNPEQEEAQEEMEINEALPLEIGVNIGSLLEAMSAYQGETIDLALNDENSSMLVRNEGIAEDKDMLNVIMPMRL